jgi:glycine reductase
MRLDLAIHPVSDAAFADATDLAGETLSIDEAALRNHLLSDGRVESVHLELVHPGESCRIGGVFDVVEPRAKEPADGSDFPGVLGPMRLAGRGTTHVLRGLAVTVLGDPPGSQIEMVGPWAEWCPYARLHHVVVAVTPRAGLPRHAALNARKQAALKAAVFLARAALGQAPTKTEVYDSAGPAQTDDGRPRFVYIGQIFSRQWSAEVDEQIFYGHNTNGLTPVLLHPNEWLDGAVIAGNAWGNVQTYFYQNSPVINELYRWQDEGKIQLVGSIATMAGGDNYDRDLNATLAAELARWNLAADAAVLTKIGGGAPHADMGLTARNCEELGMRTVVMVGPPTLSAERTVESATLFNYPEVDATVFNSGGTLFFLPAAPVERVVAPNDAAAESLATMTEIAAARVAGVTSQQGAQRLRTFVY